MKLVAYHNDINQIKIGSFTEKEIDLFFSILFKLKNKDDDTVEFDFTELKELANTTKHNDRLIKNIESFSGKLLQLNQRIELPTGEIILFNLFRTLKIDPTNKTISVSVNEDFQYMLNNLIDHFTKFDLKHLVSLKSSYSKQVFKLLKQFEAEDQEKCFYVTFLDKFKENIGSPDYTTANFNTRVLKPIMKELKPIFKDLRVTKLNKNNTTVRSGQKTVKLLFSWKQEIEYTQKKKKIESIVVTGNQEKDICEDIDLSNLSDNEKIYLEKVQNIINK